MSNFCNFVYDLHGNLRFILSPMYQDDSDIEKYAYEYRYDQRMRRVYSRRPGCEPVYYWYDKYNCLAFIQDGPLRKAGKAVSSCTTAVTALSYRASARTRRQTVCPPLSTIQAMAVYVTPAIHIPPLLVA